MKRQSFTKRVVTLLLALCLMGTMLLGIVPGTAEAVEEQDYIYFLNSEGWENVGAYIYGSKGELLGGWGTTTAIPATELGGSWMKVAVSALPPYSVIFYNKANDSQRAELYINAANKLYVTANAVAYATQEEAEAAMGIVPPVTESYPVYFLNSDQWAEVGAYIYGDQGELLGGWGSTKAATSDLGGDWVQVNVSAAPPYNIIFFNTADDSQRAELFLDASAKIYVTVTAKAYTTQADAEAAMGVVPPVTEGYPIYFLNTNGWESVGAHAYYENELGELVKPMGEWGSAIGTAATELGENWVEFSATQTPPYSLIVYNTADDTQRFELYIDAADKIYVTVNAEAFTTQEEAESAMGIVPPVTESYPIYFLNTNGWESVGAHAYYENESGELVKPMGEWGSAIGTAATELGENWVKFSATQTPPYSLIIYNTADDTQRFELYIDAAEKIYVTVNAEAFTTQAEAEDSLESEEPEATEPTEPEETEPTEPEETEPTVPVESYPVYFLNSDQWAEVGAYIYGDQGELLGGWGTTKAVASDLGGDWVQVNVSAAPPYNIIFFNATDDTQRAELYLDAINKIYVTVNAEAFTTQAEAEASLNPAEPPVTESYPIYFLNTNGWESVGAHAYYENESGELVKPMGEWGSAIGTAATELGENWVKFSATQTPPYSLIIYNTADDTQRFELYIDAADKIYVTAKAQAYTSQTAAENSLASSGKYTLYFLNSNKWAEVGAYIYGDQGELLGGWGSTIAEPASELGGNWLKVHVSALPPYSVIFYNTANPDAQRAELLIDASNKIYVTVKGQAYTSARDAEYALYASSKYTLYFLNAQKWSSVGVYIYGDQGELLGSWGSATATKASDLGGDWLKIGVPALPPYNIIFYNTADDTKRAELFIDASDKIYVTSRAQAFATREAAEKSMVSTGEYTLYFLNDKQWESVGAYIYGDQGELLGSWGSTMTEPAAELGENWLKVSVPALPPYSVIFYNTADETQRAELLIDSSDKLYINSRSQAFTSKEAAENAQASMGDYTLYFLNSNKWAEVGAYIYGDQGTLLGSWGATLAEPAPEIGEDWVKVAVTALPPYSVIFYNIADETQRAELFIDSSDKIYVAANAVAYNTKQKAEAAMGVTIQIDPENRDYGPGVEAIAEMTGTQKGSKTDGGFPWIVMVCVGAGAVVVVLAAVLLFAAKKKKA